MEDLKNYRIYYITSKNHNTQTSIHKGENIDNAILTFKNQYNHLDIKVLKIEEVPYNFNNADERYRNETLELKKVLGNKFNR